MRTTLVPPHRPDPATSAGRLRPADRRRRRRSRSRGGRRSRLALDVRARRALARLPTGPILLALAASIAVVSLRTAPGFTVEETTATSVVVATVALEVGTVVETDDVELRSLPTATLPAQVVTDADDVVGRQVTAAIFVGEPLIAGRLAPDGLLGIAAATPAGWSAFALPTEARLPAAAVGHRVDLYAPQPEAGIAGAAAGPSDRIAHRAVVVAVDDQRITVAVGPDDARAVAAALIGSTVVLAVAGP